MPSSNKNLESDSDQEVIEEEDFKDKTFLDDGGTAEDVEQMQDSEDSSERDGCPADWHAKQKAAEIHEDSITSLRLYPRKDDKLAVTINPQLWKRNSKCATCGKTVHGSIDVVMHQFSEGAVCWSDQDPKGGNNAVLLDGFVLNGDHESHVSVDVAHLDLRKNVIHRVDERKFIHLGKRETSRMALRLQGSHPLGPATHGALMLAVTCTSPEKDTDGMMTVPWEVAHPVACSPEQPDLLEDPSMNTQCERTTFLAEIRNALGIFNKEPDQKREDRSTNGCARRRW